MVNPTSGIKDMISTDRGFYGSPLFLAAGNWGYFTRRILMGAKDARDDHGVIFLDGKMNGIGKGVYRFNPDIVVPDSGSGRQGTDLLKIVIQGIGNSYPRPEERLL